jgi:uncharacterized protein
VDFWNRWSLISNVIPNADNPPKPARCACSNDRDRHWFCQGPKRILALDGGGVRGAITVAFLEQIEKVLAERLGEPIHLANWFDLIGGTSTGAVIAGALALGYTTQDIKNFYLELAPKVFRGSIWRLLRLKSKFDATALRSEIERVVGDRTLDTDDLHTGFCLVSKRLDTGSPWIIANNPRGLYWETNNTETAAENGENKKNGSIGNRHFPLGNLVRASTAAPFYFEPEWLEIVEGEEPGLFIDGGVTPHNNPSMMLFLMTILDAYQIRWKATPDDLTVVSVGTGSYRDRVVPEELGVGLTARITYRALMSLMNDIQTFVITQMQYLGECLTPWWINTELGTLENETPKNGKMFRFLRYDVRLELPWIENLGDEVEKAFGRKLTETDVLRMRSMDDPTIIADIYKLAQIAARQQVKSEHWLGEIATWCNGRRPSATPRTLIPSKPKPPPAWFSAWSFLLTVISKVRAALVAKQTGRWRD